MAVLVGTGMMAQGANEHFSLAFCCTIDDNNVGKSQQMWLEISCKRKSIIDYALRSKEGQGSFTAFCCLLSTQYPRDFLISRHSNRSAISTPLTRL